MFADTDCWLSQCKCCHLAKGDYTQPKTQQGSLVVHQPLELFCVDFTKADVAKGGGAKRTFSFPLMLSQSLVKPLSQTIKNP